MAEHKPIKIDCHCFIFKKAKLSLYFMLKPSMGTNAIDSKARDLCRVGGGTVPMAFQKDIYIYIFLTVADRAAGNNESKKLE